LFKNTTLWCQNLVFRVIHEAENEAKKKQGKKRVFFRGDTKNITRDFNFEIRHRLIFMPRIFFAKTVTGIKKFRGWNF